MSKKSAIMSTYGRMPIAFSHGQGSWLFDTNGTKYFDALTGIAVCGLGHAHPAVAEAINRQANKLCHCSNLYQMPLQEDLAKKLCQVSGMESAFFCNSGAEANEAAIKLARLYGHNKGIDKPAIIVMENSFHGRTIATLSATGNRKVQAGFEPLLSGFIRAPFNDADVLRTIATTNNNVVAIMLEPVQGEGGIRAAEPGYFKAVREICDRHDWLMITDEVQSGNGRCGRYFAYQELGQTPDIVTTAKGLGNGFPIGACLARGDAAETFKPGHHGSTFGGNPLACAAALTVIERIEQDGLATRAKTLGSRIRQQLSQAFEGSDYVKEIRGLGLMIGVELTSSCTELVPLAQSQGLLINVTQDRTVRLLPPLTMSDEEAAHLVSTLTRLIKLYAGDDRQQPR